MTRNEVPKELRIFEDIIIDALTDRRAIEHLEESFEEREAIICFTYKFKDYIISIKER